MAAATTQAPTPVSPKKSNGGRKSTVHGVRETWRDHFFEAKKRRNGNWLGIAKDLAVLQTSGRIIGDLQAKAMGRSKLGTFLLYALIFGGAAAVPVFVASWMYVTGRRMWQNRGDRVTTRLGRYMMSKNLASIDARKERVETRTQNKSLRQQKGTVVERATQALGIGRDRVVDGAVNTRHRAQHAPRRAGIASRIVKIEAAADEFASEFDHEKSILNRYQVVLAQDADHVKARRDRRLNKAPVVQKVRPFPHAALLTHATDALQANGGELSARINSVLDPTGANPPPDLATELKIAIFSADPAKQAAALEFALAVTNVGKNNSPEVRAVVGAAVVRGAQGITGQPSMLPKASDLKKMLQPSGTALPAGASGPATTDKALSAAVADLRYAYGALGTRIQTDVPVAGRTASFAQRLGNWGNVVANGSGARNLAYRGSQSQSTGPSL